MARESWATRLRNVSNLTDRTCILKSLKNTIVGNPLKKESIVVQCILDPLIQCVSKVSCAEYNGTLLHHNYATRTLEEEEICRLQGLQIIASIVLEGPRFLAPLHSSNVLPALLSNICPQSNPPQLVLAALRALLNLANSSAMASNRRALTTNTIADELFVRQHLGSLCLILSQTSASIYIQTQISVAATLISKICREDRHKQNLANSGVLDALATKLASFVVADGLVIPGAEAWAIRDNLQQYIPQPAPPNADFAEISKAISVIIANSKLRCSQLIYSPSILAVFPTLQPSDFTETQVEQTECNLFNMSAINSPRCLLNWIDHLLPSMSHHQINCLGTQAPEFPPIGITRSRDDVTLNGRSDNKSKLPTFPFWTEDSGSDSGLNAPCTIPDDHEEPESPLVAYLILTIRLRSGIERLLASAILAALYRSGLTRTKRDTDISLLTVPLLIQMLDDLSSSVKKINYIEAEELVKLDRTTKELAPAILEMFMMDSKPLQEAAFDAGVVTRLSNLLKASYDPVFESRNISTWSPRLEEEEDTCEANCDISEDNGQSPLLVHKIKVRESTLKAIAALISFKEEYRKSIVDQGLMPFIVGSMSSYASKPSVKVNEKPENSQLEPQKNTAESLYGINPISVLIAACWVIRALSRSVSILRTTLIDHKVAEPLFRLIQHPNIEVQIAATTTVINLLTHVSPMRDTFAKAGIVKILCEYAKSVNSKLRLNAVWALKHLVLEMDNEMKRHCVEELGIGWLVQIICDDMEYMALISSKEKEQKPTLSCNGTYQDTDMEQFEDQINTAFGNSDCQAGSESAVKNRSLSIQKAEAKISILRDAELDPIKKARKDDTAIQEQGLDFIRNIICGADKRSGTTEMVDYLFSSLGQDRVFEILASKLRPKAINPYNRKASGSVESKVIPPQAEIIASVGFILVHMAASVPRHRQLIISQTELLKLIVPQFNNSNDQVRIAFCWLVTNLTWMDDQKDGQSCAQRASELKKLGFLAKLEMLKNDPELDVRERAKNALWQMERSY